MWIDNSSAVSWTNKRSSPSPYGQTLLRLLSLAETTYNLVITAEHIPGEENIMADAGSWAWEVDDPLYDLWTNMSSLWKQVVIPECYKTLSEIWEHCSKTKHLAPLRISSTHDIGINGKDFANSCDGQAGLKSTSAEELVNWANLRCIAGSLASTNKESGTLTPQSKGNCPVSDGCTADTSESILDVVQSSLSCSKESDDFLTRSEKCIHSQSKSSIPSVASSISSTLDIVSCGAPYSSDSFSFCADRNISKSVGKDMGIVSTLNKCGSQTVTEPKQVSKKLPQSQSSLAEPKMINMVAEQPEQCTSQAMIRSVQSKHYDTSERHLEEENMPMLQAKLNQQPLRESSSLLPRSLASKQKNYSTHSVRIGGATALLNAGVDRLAIKLLGRWLSSCFEDYPVQEARGTRKLATAMVQ